MAVGAMTIITSTNQLVVMPVQGICQGAQPIISYNYGANKKDRVKKAFFLQFKICVIFTCISWLVMMLFPQIFAGMFTSDASLVSYTSWALRIYMAGIFALGFQVSCQKGFMALGQAKVSLVMACLRKLILLIPLIFTLPLLLSDKVFAVFLAEPVSDIIAAIVTTTVFMAKDELFRGAAGGFFRALGTIPVNRRIRDASALSEAQKVLEAGGIIGIFPEGSFNRTKETVMPFKPGAARMAARSHAALVPFAIKGKYTVIGRRVEIEFYPAIETAERDAASIGHELENTVREGLENGKR